MISIVYHSEKGHTGQVARCLSDKMKEAGAVVHLIEVEAVEAHWDHLHASDAIVFGSPTYFGNVSAAFKRFMEATGQFWYRQLWRNKFAAAFTVSSTSNGDKLNTLHSLFLFAAQHSMHWISLGVLPRFINDEQTDGQNRLASYIGLMTQCNNSQTRLSPLHPGDMLTAELFADRIVQVVARSKGVEVSSPR